MAYAHQDNRVIFARIKFAFTVSFSSTDVDRSGLGRSQTPGKRTSRLPAPPASRAIRVNQKALLNIFAGIVKNTQ